MRLSGTEGWAAKTTVYGVPVLAAGRYGGAAEEGQRHLGHRRGVGAHSLVHRAETLRVLAGVGEDDVRAVPQQQAVGELLVDDADIAGDDDGPLRRVPARRGESVQHGLDGAADEGEHDDVVRLLAS